MTHETDTAPERLWAEPSTMVPINHGLWVATSVQPDPCTHLVEYVRADVMEKTRTSDQCNYYRLLYAVATKHPGEDRVETALRYIEEAERGSCQTGAGQEVAKQAGD